MSSEITLWLRSRCSRDRRNQTNYAERDPIYLWVRFSQSGMQGMISNHLDWSESSLEFLFISKFGEELFVCLFDFLFTSHGG